MKLRKQVWCLLLAGTLQSGVSSVEAASLDPVSPRQLVEQADLIFAGVVADVQYRNSDISGPDDVALPHTFVTFAVENVLKGSVANGSHITLRFEGGRAGQNKAMLVPGIPLFDVGDRDILFVKGNGAVPCPLVGWEQGRFRNINNTIYTDGGQAVGAAAGERLNLGSYHALDEVVTHNLGGTPLVFGEPGAGAASPTPQGAPQLDAAGFTQFLTHLIQQVDTPQRLAALKPVASARIQEPFHVQAPQLQAPPSAPEAAPDSTPEQEAGPTGQSAVPVQR
jgi:hypothetical protein